MDLQDYLALAKTVLEIESVKKLSESAYVLERNKRTFKLYQQGKQVFLEGSIGTSIKESAGTNTMLSELLQFNLKRTQFLDNIIFLDDETHQLFLREVFPAQDMSSEQLKEKLEDFVLNIEVIEDRFFKEKTALS
ncbi:MAG: CesT family type III secretion system chaperone [bacterium]